MIANAVAVQCVSHLSIEQILFNLENNMTIEQYTASLLVAMLHLLDDADPTSLAAIEARKLLAQSVPK